MIRSGRSSIALALGAAALVGLVFAGLAILRQDDSDREGPRYGWNYYRPSPTGIEIFKTVRSCDDVTGAHVDDETSERIVVAIEVDMGGVCGDDAVDQSAVVTLSESLGGRPVYDAVCLSDSRPESDCLREIR